MAVIWPPYVSKIDPLNDTKTDPLPGAGACGSCGRGGPELGFEEPCPRSLWAALRGWTSKLAVHSSGSFHRPSKLDRRRERGFGFGGHGVRRGSSPFVPVRTIGGTQSSTWTKRSNDPPSRSTTARNEYR